MEPTTAYFQTLIETSSDAIVLMDEKGTVVYQTPSTERINGYSLEDMQHLDGIELIHPDDRADDYNAFVELLKTPGAVLQRKHRLRHKNGNYIWIEGTYRNLLHDENLKAIVFNYADVTARVLSELRLKERIKELSTIYSVHNILQDDTQSAATVFTKIVNLLPAGWQYPDICEARIVFEGQQYCTARYAPSPLQQRVAINIVDGRTGMIEVIYTRDMPHEDEGPFLREERDLINTLARTIEVYFNKKSNQDALAKSGANLQSIFDNTQVAYLLLDVRYHIMAYNQYYRTGYADLTGSVLEIGKNYLDLIRRDKLDDVKRILESVCANVTPIEYETYFTNGTKLTYFNVTVSPVLNNGSVIGFCVAAQDITNRKNTEIEKQKIAEQLKENANLLQIFVEYSPAAIAMFDMNMNYVQVSRRWMVDYNLGDVNVVGKNHYEVFPNVPEVWKDIHQRCLAGASERNNEDSFIREDGTLDWLQWEIHPWRKASGEIGGIIMFTEVITERKETEMKFRNLVEKSLVGVYILQNGKFAYVNPNITQESGYTEEELTGMPVERLVFKDDLETMYKNIQARLSGELESVRYELRVLKKNGGLLWLEMFGTTTMYRGAPAIIGTMINITEQKAVYTDLKNSEANLKSIFDNARMSYVLLDDQFTVLMANEYFIKGYEAQTGISMRVGANFLDMIMPDKRAGIQDVLQAVLTKAIPVEYESVYTNKIGAKYFSSVVNPVISNGKTIGLCYSGMDVTERKNNEIEREKIVNDLIQRNRDLEQFAYIVSHNVRGPLSSILGLNNMAIEDPVEEEKELIHQGIKASAEKLDSVIKDLNEILQIRRELSESKVNVNLKETVENIKGTIRQLIRDKNVNIAYDFTQAENLLTVQSYINSIFFNLITNSIKFAQAGVPPVIKIWTEFENDMVRINFQDNGIGIDLERYGDRVFNLYNRFHHAVEGKGLGLYMTKTKVEVLNGSISVESKLGEGSLFKVVFPA